MTKRRAMTPARKLRILVKQATCALCNGPLGDVFGIEFDHEIALACGGSDEDENIRALCRKCHAEKTAEDAKPIAKIRRLRGEKGQQARRAKHGSKLRSRGFDKTYRKRMDGTVERRE